MGTAQTLDMAGLDSKQKETATRTFGCGQAQHLCRRNQIERVSDCGWVGDQAPHRELKAGTDLIRTSDHIRRAARISDKAVVRVIGGSKI